MRDIAPVDLAIPTRYARQLASGLSRIINRIRGPGGRLMNTFDKRQEGFEKKFAHDEELRFKATARRNRLLGLWAAEKMGLSGDEAAAYAKEVVIADFEESGDEDVFRKIRADFDAKSIDQSDHQIRRSMTELMEKAITEIKAG
jgi:hypothetical protein